MALKETDHCLNTFANAIANHEQQKSPTLEVTSYFINKVPFFERLGVSRTSI